MASLFLIPDDFKDHPDRFLLSRIMRHHSISGKKPVAVLLSPLNYAILISLLKEKLVFRETGSLSQSRRSTFVGTRVIEFLGADDRKAVFVSAEDVRQEWHLMWKHLPHRRFGRTIGGSVLSHLIGVKNDPL